MGTLTFQATAGGSVNLLGPNISGTVNLTLPSADGTSGQPLQTNGSGTLSFANLAIANGGTGVTSFAANQIHYGSFSQSANLTFNGTTLTANTLNLTNALGTAYGGTGLTSFTTNGVVYASSTSALATGSALTFDGTNFQTGRIRFSDNTLSGFGGVEITSLSGVGMGLASLNYVFYNAAANSEYMRLTSTGLGIGTSSPANKLVVSNAGAAGFEFDPTNGIMQTYNRSGAAYTTTNILASSINFKTGASPATTVIIDSSGNLLVGTTDSSGGNTTGFEFYYGAGSSRYYIGHITGTASGTNYIQFNYNGAGIGSITQSGTTAVLFNVTSDQRLKENIVDAPEFGSLIDSLQVRSFDWKTDNTHQRAGFIAQELVTVAPEAVHQPADPEEMMAVDYSKLVPMLVKEIQSLRKRLADASIA